MITSTRPLTIVNTVVLPKVNKANVELLVFGTTVYSRQRLSESKHSVITWRALNIPFLARRKWKSASSTLHFTATVLDEWVNGAE